jgi:hypothetical protein
MLTEKDYEVGYIHMKDADSLTRLGIAEPAVELGIITRSRDLKVIRPGRIQPSLKTSFGSHKSIATRNICRHGFSRGFRQQTVDQQQRWQIKLPLRQDCTCVSSNNRLFFSTLLN